MVGMIRVRSRVSSNCREQRKFPPKTVCRSASTDLESLGYGICNRRFSRSGLTRQPEDTGAPRRGIVGPLGDVLQYLDTGSDRAFFTPEGLVFEIGFVVSHLGGTQAIQVSLLFNRLGRRHI